MKLYVLFDHFLDGVEIWIVQVAHKPKYTRSKKFTQDKNEWRRVEYVDLNEQQDYSTNRQKDKVK